MIGRAVLILGLCCGGPVLAQETVAPLQLADRGPSFFASSSRRDAAPVDVRNAKIFRERIGVNVDNVSVRDALTAISKAANVPILFSPDVLPADAKVTLQADKIPLGAALTAALIDASVDVELSPGDVLTIVPRGHRRTSVASLQGSGTISGVIRDSVTGGPLPQAMVRVDGTTFEAKAAGDGTYRITGLGAGEFRVTVRRVGFLAKTQAVAVGEGETKTLNFLMNAPATQLNEVVTTALGEQRRYQVGNVIASINVDSLAPTAPVTSVTDLIAGRAAGVEVLQTSGLVGSGASIRIRGQSSMLIAGDPIIIVDGVRQDNTPGGTLSFINSTSVPTTSRINDLDFTQIETIDVLKGPAASTEYGTDAANGVIVITTKRGVAGKPQWHATAQQAASEQPDHLPDYYYTWGHSTNGRRSSEVCPLLPEDGGYYAQYGSPYNLGSTFGVCVADSVTHFNPLNNAATTIYGTGPSNRYDLDVGGGSDAFHYYLAGGLSNAQGNTHLPNVFRPIALALGYPASDLKPNSENQRSARANINVRLSSTVETQLNLSYSSTFQKTLSDPHGLGDEAADGPSLDDSLHNWGWGNVSYGQDPLAYLGQTANQQTDAMVGGFVATWRPQSWFTAHATFGLQHESQSMNGVNLPQSYIWTSGGSDSSGGSLELTTGYNDVYTVDLRASATAALTRGLQAITSVGLQLADTRAQTVEAYTYGDVTASNLTLNNNSSVSVTQNNTRSATLGGYVEEELGLADRLFVTGALRIDAGSGFGNSNNFQAYEKAGLSWLAINGDQTTVRLRGSYGAAGQQPPAGSAIQQYISAPVMGSTGNTTTGYGLSLPGTPGLRPEHSAEYEGGADVTLWHNRVSVEVTAYNKTTNDAIYPLPLGFEFDNITYYVNLGTVNNNGIETSLSATVVDTRAFVWTVNVQSSINGNKLVQLSSAQLPHDGVDLYGNAFYERFAPGYSLYGIWAAQIHYTDANHDGFLETKEVALDTAISYLGGNEPREESSLGTHIGLLRGTFAIGALFDYKSGYKEFNNQARVAGLYSGAQAENVLGSPLSRQLMPFEQNNLNSAFFQDGTFCRFRELNLTYMLPARWARSAHLSTINITAAVQNLVLWTRFDGDPEAGGAGSGGWTSEPNTNGYTVNNDLRAFDGSIPLMRSWSVRLNVGF